MFKTLVAQQNSVGRGNSTDATVATTTTGGHDNHNHGERGDGKSLACGHVGRLSCAWQSYILNKLFFAGAGDYLITEFLSQNIVDGLRVSFTRGRFHYLPHQETDYFFLSCTDLFGLVGKAGNDVADGLFDGAAVGNLGKASTRDNLV